MASQTGWASLWLLKLVGLACNIKLIQMTILGFQLVVIKGRDKVRGGDKQR